MPIIRGTDAATFILDGATFVGLAAPSRGSAENSVWRVMLTSTDPGALHTLDREEVLIALSGRAVATLDGDDHSGRRRGRARRPTRRSLRPALR